MLTTSTSQFTTRKFSTLIKYVALTTCLKPLVHNTPISRHGKGKDCPRRGHECTEAKYVCRSTLSLISALFEGGWLRPRPGSSTLVTHCTGSWVGPRAGIDGCKKSSPYRDSIPGPSRHVVPRPTLILCSSISLVLADFICLWRRMTNFLHAWFMPWHFHPARKNDPTNITWVACRSWNVHSLLFVHFVASWRESGSVMLPVHLIHIIPSTCLTL